MKSLPQISEAEFEMMKAVYYLLIIESNKLSETEIDPLHSLLLIKRRQKEGE